MNNEKLLKFLKEYYEGIDYKERFDLDMIKACEEDNLYDTISNHLYDYDRQELKSLILNLLDFIREN